MTDDPVFLIRKGAYTSWVKDRQRRARKLGRLGVQLGLAFVLWRLLPGETPDAMVRTSYALLGGGILLLAYASARRSLYLRAHPFDPQA